MAKIIEAKAILSAEDRTGKAFDSLNRRMKDVGKGMKVSADVDRLTKSLAETKRQLEAIDRFKGSQASFAAVRTRFRGAQEDVTRLAAELAAAKRNLSQFDGVKAFSKNGGIGREMAEAARRVTELERGLDKARRNVSSASDQFDAQATALKGAKREAEALGIALHKLGEEEARLKRRAEATTGAIGLGPGHDPAGRPRIPAAILHPPRRELAGRATENARGIGVGDASAAAALRYGAASAGVAGGGILIAGSLRKAYASAMSFERSMIEVGKATDASGAELASYGERVLKLSRDTGKTKEELASMLSAAGFAGRPKQELMDFTEYGAKATVAWQTSAEETGQALAELGNIYEANQKRIEEIGDAINVMADNSASKESDLLDFLRRAGASGKTANIAAEDMLAFGAAMKEVGVRNEVAGTGMEALLNVMKLGEEFSKSAGKGLEELGVNSDKMRKSFVAKPVETIVDLLEKLNKVADPLKKAEIMTNLFGKEYQDDMAKLLNALPKIRQYLALMNDKAQIAKGGVRFQFGQNLDKDVSKIDRASRAIDTMLQRFGEPIKAKAGGIAEEITNMVDRLEQGDTILQRLMSRVTGNAPGDPPKMLEIPKVDGESTAEEWMEKNLPWLSGKTWNQGLDSVLGKTGKEASQKYWSDKAAADAQERLQQLDRIKSKEEEIARVRGVVDSGGRAAGPAKQRVALLENELAALKAGLGAIERAQTVPRPLRMGIDPTAPIEGKPGAITPGPLSWQQAYPLDLSGAHPAMKTAPLPPRRPASLPSQGGIGSIDEVLGPAPRAAVPDARLDASVHGPITAEVKSLPPLTGEVKGQAQVTGHITVEPSQWFTTKFNGLEQSVMQLSGKVSSIGSAVASNGPGSTGKSSPDAGKGSRE